MHFQNLLYVIYLFIYFPNVRLVRCVRESRTSNHQRISSAECVYVQKHQTIHFTHWSVSHALDIQYEIFTTLSNDLLANDFISPAMQPNRTAEIVFLTDQSNTMKTRVARCPCAQRLRSDKVIKSGRVSRRSMIPGESHMLAFLYILKGVVQQAQEPLKKHLGGCTVCV